MRIRRATEADADRCVAMGGHFYATAYYAETIPYDPASGRVIFDYLLTQGILLVAEAEGAIVGMVGLVVAPFIFNTAHRSAHEVMWWVEPGRRASGAGLALLRAIEPAAREAGVVMIQMMNLASSPEHTSKIYERLGFKHSESSFSKAI